MNLSPTLLFQPVSTSFVILFFTKLREILHYFCSLYPLETGISRGFHIQKSAFAIRNRLITSPWFSFHESEIYLFRTFIKIVRLLTQNIPGRHLLKAFH